MRWRGRYGVVGQQIGDMELVGGQVGDGQTDVGLVDKQI